MRTVRLIVLIGILGLVSSSLAVPAYAQDDERPLKASAAYVLDHAFANGASLNYPLGFSFRAGRELQTNSTTSLGAFADFRWNHHGETQSVGTSSSDSSQNLMSLYAGGRYMWTMPVFRPFVRAEAGWTRDSFSSTFGNQSYSSSESGLGILFQTGVSKKLNNRMSVFGGIGFGRRFFSSADNSWEFDFGLDDFCPICWLKDHSS